MAKRRKPNPKDDHDQLSYCLTLLLAAVSPAIDKAATYELMYELLEQGLDEQTVKTYGALVKASVFETDTRH